MYNMLLENLPGIYVPFLLLQKYESKWELKFSISQHLKHQDRKYINKNNSNK